MKLLQKKKKQKEQDSNKPVNEQSDSASESSDYQLDTKGSIWDVIAPDGISINDPDFGIMKQSLGTKTYFRPFYIPPDGFPRKMRTNWINSLSSSGEIDLLIDVHKVSKTDAIRTLQRQETMLQSNLSWQKKRGNIDQINDLETKILDTTILADEIQFSENDMFNVSVLGMMYGQTEKELDRYSEQLEDQMAGEFFKLATTWSRVKKGMMSVLPMGKNQLPESLRNIDRRALTTFAPFISGSGRYLGGVPIGINMITGQKEFINNFGTEEVKPPNYNMGLFGIPGSGKSLAMKLMIARNLTGANLHATIIDPEGEFIRLTKRLGGINLNISEESDIVINPCAINYTDIELDEDDEELDLLDESDKKEIIEKNGKKFIRFVPTREKISEILSFFDIIIRGKNSEEEGLTVFERNYLEEATQAVFDELGITTHPSSLFSNEVKEIDGQIVQSKARKPEPELNQIYKYIVKNFGEEEKAERLIAATKPFLKTGSKPLFDGQSYFGKGVTANLQTSRLINFNISQLEEGFLRPIAFHVILNYLWEYFAKSLENATKKKLIVCDELWQFIDNDQTVSFFEKVARRIRKRNGGLLYASQDFVRILENPKSRGILTSTYSNMFLQQNKIDLKKIRENFDLTDGEIDILFGNPSPGSGILRVGKSSVWLQTDPSEDELTFIESNTAVLEELLNRKRLRQQQAR